jgi:hypothetical protein
MPEIMPTTEDAIDQELEETHVRLIRELASVGRAQGVYILTPPPADDPE